MITCQYCEEEWRQIIHTKPKLRSYIKFKMKYYTEEYLKMCMTKYQRSLLSQFRAGILPLRIETGRFHVKSDTENGNVRYLQVEERTCQMCNSHEIENEFHFLLVCPIYNDYRANLFNSIRVSHEFNTMTMDEKFIFINKMYQKNLAKYICLSWERRKSILYN